jgi:PqqD family protein of HPr-rel-A system
MTERFSAAVDIDTAPLDGGGLVLFHPASGKFVLLNKSSTVLWSEMACPLTESELAEKLCERFPDVTPPVAQEDVRQAVEQLRKLELVKVTAEETS